MSADSQVFWYALALIFFIISVIYSVIGKVWNLAFLAAGAAAFTFVALWSAVQAT